MSWHTEKTASAIPAAPPSFPVMGARIKAATTTRTSRRLMRIVPKNENAFADVTEDLIRVRVWLKRATKGKKDQGRSLRDENSNL